MTQKINYLELSVERAQWAAADEHRRNAIAQWQGDLYSPHDIERLRNELRLALAADADKELARDTDAYVERNLSGAVPFPSCGLAVLAVLDTADRLRDFVRVAFVQAVVDRLRSWIADEQAGEIPFGGAGEAAAIVYPLGSEGLIGQAST